MKILYLTDLLSPYRVEWMNMLTREHEVIAFYLDESEVTREERWLKSKEVRFKTKKVKYTEIAGIRYSKEIFKIYKESNADLFIIDGYASLVQVWSILWLVKKNKKVFVNVDGIDIWKKRTIGSRIKEIIKVEIYHSGAKFLCGSKLAAENIIEMGANEENVYVHPFTSLHKEEIVSLEEKQARQKEYKEKLGIASKKMVVAVGRFIPLKRYDILIKAWKNMPDECVLFLIGGGTEKEKYENIIKSNDIHNIHIFDFMMPEKLSEYYLAADLFVHPSSTETWGLVINEAMSKANPVIATNRCVAGVELIRNGYEGYVVEVDNIGELHEKMKLILQDNELRYYMSKNVVSKIQSYTYEELFRTHNDIFKQVVG